MSLGFMHLEWRLHTAYPNGGSLEEKKEYSNLCAYLCEYAEKGYIVGYLKFLITYNQGN